MCYGQKNSEVVFQLPFMVESRKMFGAERFFILSQTFYRLAENEMTFG